MLASLADAPLDDPAAGLRTEVRRHPRHRRDRAEGRGPPLVAARQREDAAVSRDRGGARALGARAQGAARARRRDRRARRQGRAGRIPAAAGTHSSVRRRRRAPGARTALIAFDMLQRRHDRLPRPAADRAARRAREGVRRAPDRRCCASASRSAATAARCTSRRSIAAGKG